ncbi:MAG TPA: DUF885 domain-containing protein [Ideonella sp.]|uniref:DUF885 domain-containing protein n=1 Tax=Ideonella sp. TaxID=1929293 RepID=UPI002E376CAC|nr:DUF885 domain-containing protein [Ideonella sp.]HEX5684636.1 DUF885 domain-containing protein [Ideonella sp.]
MLRFVIMVAALVTGSMAAWPVHAKTGAAPASRALHQLFADQWERTLRESPETASYNGDTRYDDRWSDMSLAAIAKQEAADRAALAKLHTINRKALSAADRVHYDTFEWQLKHTIERQRFREYLEPINQRSGVQLAAGIAEIMPFDDVAAYRRYLARMATLPLVIDQVIALMQEGVRTGHVPPRVLIERVPAQIGAQIVDDPAASPFYRPFQRFPAAVAEADRQALGAEALQHVRERIVPAYRKLLDYVNANYLPKARTTVAATDGPDGAAYYAFRARYYTTTDLSVDAIHETGLREVARLRAAMDKLQAEIGFQGTREAFFKHLRSDPKFFYPTPEALLEAYRAVAKRIDPELVRVFRTVPRMPYGVRPIPAEAAPDATAGYYQGGATDGSRPAFFYANLYQPESRPRWEMLPLALHEAVPGHHFQFARALELPEMPMFRKTAYFVAYSEGWALYAEQLGYDMGLYDDPYERYGQLTYEMWRAVRLVVDTGLHAKGWSREQAIAYFKDNAPKTELDIVNEVDRYIGDPGQALAYKIGQLKISELRQRAQLALGKRFNLRGFNDAVLETGSVPLTALEARIDLWIAQQRRAAAPH